MKTAFILDSSAGCRPDLQARPDVYIIHLTVNFSDGTSLEDSSEPQLAAKFYEELPQLPDIPQTSQPSYGAYLKLVDQIIADGFEQVIAIHLSGQISGTVQTAQMVMKKRSDQIQGYVIDSRGTSYQMEHLMLEGMQMLEAELPMGDVIEELNWLAQESRIYVYIKDLNNLLKGGRITSLSKSLGQLLRIYPIIKFEATGALSLYDKIRTFKKVEKTYMSLIASALGQYPSGLTLAFAHGGATATVEQLSERVKELYPELKIRSGYLTPVLGAHGGQGCVGMGLLVKNRLLND